MSSKPLVATKDNLELMTAEKPLTQHEADLKAERALIVATINLEGEVLSEFLEEIGCSHAELKAVYDKHSHVIKRYREELNDKPV